MSYYTVRSDINNKEIPEIKIEKKKSAPSDQATPKRNGLASERTHSKSMSKLETGNSVEIITIKTNEKKPTHSSKKSPLQTAIDKTDSSRKPNQPDDTPSKIDTYRTVNSHTQTLPASDEKKSLRSLGNTREVVEREALELLKKVVQNPNLGKSDVDELKEALSEPFKIKISQSKEFAGAVQVGLEFRGKFRKASGDGLEDTSNGENENIAVRMSKDRLSNQRIPTNREKWAAEKIGDSIDVNPSEISGKDQDSSLPIVITPKEGQVSQVTDVFQTKAIDDNILPKDGENLLGANF